MTRPSKKKTTTARPRKAEAKKKPKAGTRKAGTGRKPARFTRKELVEFERALLDEKRRILRQGRATDELMEPSGTDVTSGEPTRRTHAAEVGGESHQVEVASRLKQMEGTVMREIVEALARIVDGSYGICEACGEPVPRARLEIVPHARLCMKCLKKR
ncbi:MAG TPA: hypothetical protein ENN51_08980 [candidate division WOR-3 bacterium]|uniref:Zinc finger DksA/TraR C4-type domain-containing protein n=1 Tax=candidate division WOR-3 bacterium TaxID=2052148 RepID=A0A7V0T7I3_UNCW3|nr:hypothetical protein [candidate division WOR-3 bacterium]